MPPIHINILHHFDMTFHIHYAKKVWVMQKEEKKEKISMLKEHEKKEKEKKERWPIS
jgi:hypothetical protein